MYKKERDYYEILGVPKDADQKTIKDAYHRLAMKWHPDRSKSPDAQHHFKEIAKAYAIQGKGAIFIEGIVGSHTNVIGLPLMETVMLLRSFGVRL